MIQCSRQESNGLGEGGNVEQFGPEVSGATCAIKLIPRVTYDGNFQKGARVKLVEGFESYRKGDRGEIMKAFHYGNDLAQYSSEEVKRIFQSSTKNPGTGGFNYEVLFDGAKTAERCVPQSLLKRIHFGEVGITITIVNDQSETYTTSVVAIWPLCIHLGHLSYEEFAAKYHGSYVIAEGNPDTLSSERLNIAETITKKKAPSHVNQQAGLPQPKNGSPRTKEFQGNLSSIEKKENFIMKIGYSHDMFSWRKSNLRTSTSTFQKNLWRNFVYENWLKMKLGCKCSQIWIVQCSRQECECAYFSKGNPLLRIGQGNYLGEGGNVEQSRQEVPGTSCELKHIPRLRYDGHFQAKSFHRGNNLATCSSKLAKIICSGVDGFCRVVVRSVGSSKYAEIYEILQGRFFLSFVMDLTYVGKSLRSGTLPYHYSLEDSNKIKDEVLDLKFWEPCHSRTLGGIKIMNETPVNGNFEWDDYYALVGHSRIRREWSPIPRTGGGYELIENRSFLPDPELLGKTLWKQKTTSPQEWNEYFEERLDLKQTML